MEFTTGPDGGISRVRLYPPLVDEVSELQGHGRCPGPHGVECIGRSPGRSRSAGAVGARWRRSRRDRGVFRCPSPLRIPGSADGVRVYDDYAHHPTEVRAVLSAARATAGDGRVVAVFQPPVLRTQEFAREFATALRPADEVIVADVYGARESRCPASTVADRRAHARPGSLRPRSVRAGARGARRRGAGRHRVDPGCRRHHDAGPGDPGGTGERE